MSVLRCRTLKVFFLCSTRFSEEILQDGSFFRVESVRAKRSLLQVVSGQRYAVKVFSERSSEHHVQRAHRERDLLKSLQHPGVANLVVAFQWLWCGKIQRVLVMKFHGGCVLGDEVAAWGSQGVPLACGVKCSGWGSRGERQHSAISTAATLRSTPCLFAKPPKQQAH